MRTEKRILSFAITVVLSLSLATTLHAAATSLDFDFYKGKLITYIVATKPGGGYDAYARLINKYLQKYIPGSTVMVKNVAGGGHIIGANETYLAKPDGLTIGTFNTGLIFSQILGFEGIKFDLAKYSWIGKANSEHRVLVVSAKSPYKTIKDLIESKEPIKLGSAGAGTSSSNEALILGEALGFPVKMTYGYGGREAEIAMMRGEITGTEGSYTGLVNFIKSKESRVLLQIAGKKHQDLPDVPLGRDLKLSDRGKKLVALIAATAELGRLTAAPPNTPPERLGVLRDAYKKAMADPNLLKDAQKLGLEIDPGYGDDVAKLMNEAIHQPAENVAMLKKTIKVE